jgi:hypothetical protein
MSEVLTSQNEQIASMNRINLYNDQKANDTNVWIFFLFFGWSYGSLGKMGLQVAFYLTFGGLGVWTLVRLFTLSNAIKEYNRNVSGRLMLTEQEKIQVGLYI